MTRLLEWEGCLNVRDLGGVPLADGGETPYGALIRADNIGRLTDEGWRALARTASARIVDLRWPEEIGEDPPRDVDIDVVHVSLLGELDPDFTDDVRDYMAVDDPAGYWAVSYTRILHAFAPNFARALEAIADAPTAPSSSTASAARTAQDSWPRCSSGSPVSTTRPSPAPTTQ